MKGRVHRKASPTSNQANPGSTPGAATSLTRAEEAALKRKILALPAVKQMLRLLYDKTPDASGARFIDRLRRARVAKRRIP